MERNTNHVVILDGHPGDADEGYLRYLEKLEISLGDRGITTTICHLKDLDLRYCTGCWTCWWGTPGECVLKDGMTDLYPVVMQSDLVLYVSPMVAGYVSALTKKVMDRMIPLLHPYIEVVAGECHHRKRYEEYPRLALLVQPEQDSDEEDMEILRELMNRLALNFRSACDFVDTMDTPVEEVLHEAVNA